MWNKALVADVGVLVYGLAWHVQSSVMFVQLDVQVWIWTKRLVCNRHEMSTAAQRHSKPRDRSFEAMFIAKGRNKSEMSSRGGSVISTGLLNIGFGGLELQEGDSAAIR